MAIRRKSTQLEVSEEIMVLKFTLNEEDLYRYWIHSVLESKIWKRRRITQYVVFVIITIAVTYKLLFIKAEFGIGELIAVCFALYVGFLRSVFLKFLLKLRIKRMIKQDTDGTLLGEKEIHFNDEVMLKSGEMEGRAGYNDFILFEQDEQAFYLVLPDSSGVIIPKRIFNSENEKENFHNFISEKMRTA